MSGRGWRRCVRVLPAALLLWLGWAASAGAIPAAAHANLVQSEPAANSVLPQAPAVLQLWFSEAPEPRFSEIVLYDSTGARVPTPALQRAPEDRLLLYVRLDALPVGVYTVAWKTLSAVDGHTTGGAFAFGVGVEQAVTGPALGAVAPGGQTSQATPGSVVLRWIGYMGLAGLLGALGFVPLVLAPALAALRAHASGAASGGPAADWTLPIGQAAVRQARRAAWLAWGLTLGVTLVGAVAQASQAAGVSLLEALRLGPGAPLPTLLLATRYGQVWFGRLLLLGLLAGALTRIRPMRSWRGRQQRSVWYIAGALAALVTLTTSLNSHGAAVQPTEAAGAPLLPLVADWIHLLATGLWVGGLLQLVVSVPPALRVAGPARRLPLLAALVPVFSSVAMTCVAALVVTGLYQTVLQVESWGALLGTPYGQALVVKLVLFVPLLFLGAVNLLLVRPRLAQAARGALASAMDGSGGPQRLSTGREGGEVAGHERGATPPALPLVRAFRLAMGAEVVLAAGVLFAAGTMTAGAPAKAAWAEQTRGVTVEQTAGDLQVRLRIDPGTPGFNAFSLLVRDRQGRLVDGAEKVALILSHQQMDMGENELVLAPQGDGRYAASSGLTSMAGPWDGEALIRRTGRDDVRVPFLFAVVDAPVVGQGAPSAGPGVPGAASTRIAPADARALRNPVPTTEESLAVGRQLYEQNCMACHGVQGRGDGPAARSLRPPPADLAQHVTQHTEGELWWWVTNGITGTAMPAWKDALTDGQRWQVVNYIVRTFAPAGQ